MKTLDATQKMLKVNEAESFTYSFYSSKSRVEIFQLLLNIKQWWFGVYNETITGATHNLNDEFAFQAGEGAHYSRHKLVALVPNKHITWSVTESNLAFLQNTSEWNGTSISFDLATEGNGTKVTFMHNGLVPEFECYSACTNAWTQYMENLKAKLQ